MIQSQPLRSSFKVVITFAYSSLMFRISDLCCEGRHALTYASAWASWTRMFRLGAVSCLLAQTDAPALENLTSFQEF